MKTSEFCFFFLCGGKEIIHCFRNIFRNPSATTAPASATCISHITLPRASATLFSWFLLPRPQRHYVFQGFWLWLVSFPFILAFWAFICFHFWLFFCYVRLSWAWTLRGHWQGVPLFGHVFLPRCFREASARLPRNTEAKPVTKPAQHRIGVIWQQFIPKSNPIRDMKTELHQDIQIHYSIRCILPTSPSATFREGHPSAKLPRPEPCAFFKE